MRRTHRFPSHPFGDLLSMLRARKHGLTQAKLAEMAGYDPAVIARMGQGQKDLTGTQARERVVRVIRALDEADVLYGPDEANALLEAADMPPLFAGDKAEAVLLGQLELHRRNGSDDIRNLPSAPRHNLPAQLTSFIGREGEIAQVTQFLSSAPLASRTATRSDARLVTLTGPGGVGKTRLALEAATALLDELPDGVWWVPLSSLNDPSLVAQAVADTFALNRNSDESLLRVLVDYLQKRRLLLLLDNCEHLVDACADLAAHLMSHCPQLRILATSREALQVPGELALRVPPLTVPRAPVVDTNAALDFDAVQLFVERAQAIRPDFELTTDNADAVAHVCNRLDGIPLALELAAALLQVMSVEEIAARIDNRFALLKGGYRAVTPRHQALSNAIDWSYDLLTPTEQTLLARLSVFAGAWSAEAAEGICADDAIARRGKAAGFMSISAQVDPAALPLRRADVLPTLRQLVNKSLVVIDSKTSESTRYRLLKTIHEYASEKLRETGEQRMIQDNHLDAMVRLAEEANTILHADQEQPTWDRLLEQQDELRAALVHAEQSGNAEALLRLAAALQPFWRQRGLPHEEGTAWMNKALALGKVAPARLRAALMFEWTWTYGREEDAIKRLAPEVEACLAECRAAQDEVGIAQSQAVLGSIAAESNDIATARACFGAALRIFEARGDSYAVWNVRHKMANALQREDSAAAEAWMRESIKRYSAEGENKRLSTALADLAWLLEDKYPGDARILDVWRQSVSAAEAAGNLGLKSEFLAMFGYAELAAGDRVGAAEHFAQSMQIACDTDSNIGLKYALEALREVDAPRAESILKAYLLRKQQAGDKEGG